MLQHSMAPGFHSRRRWQLSVIEHLLQDVYILPQKMKAEFK
jgi:hypothetical protein